MRARRQTLAALDTVSGEVVIRTLMHEGNEVREFYAQLPDPLRVGIDTCHDLVRDSALIRSSQTETVFQYCEKRVR